MVFVIQFACNTVLVVIVHEGIELVTNLFQPSDRVCNLKIVVVVVTGIQSLM